MLVLIDTFTGRTEAFSTHSEKVMVVKVLLKEVIPPVWTTPAPAEEGLETSFIFQITQGVAKALGIKYHLCSTWWPQSAEKVEKANQILK